MYSYIENTHIHSTITYTTMSFFSVFWPILSPCRVEVPFLVHNYHRDTIRKPTTTSRPSNCNDLSALKVAAKEKMDYPTSKYDSPFISTIRCFLLFPLSTARLLLHSVTKLQKKSEWILTEGQHQIIYWNKIIRRLNTRFKEIGTRSGHDRDEIWTKSGWNRDKIEKDINKTKKVA